MFRLAASAALLTVLTVSATARAAEPDPNASATTAGVMSAISGDWNGDGIPDRAVLTDNGDSAADLWVWFGGDKGFALAAHAPGIAYNGGMFGTMPELKLTAKGGLQISDGNTLGRDHWMRVLTLAYRGGRLVVAGVTLSHYDAFDVSQFHSCDVNLLTGKGVRDKKPVRVAGAPVAVSDWSDDKVPAVCQF